jgi:hypothetical protein
MTADPIFPTEPLYAVRLHVIEPHNTLGYLCATTRSTHAEMWIGGEDVTWLGIPMAGRIGTALLPQQVAVSYEELERACEVVFNASDMNR